MDTLDSLRGHGLKVLWSGSTTAESGREDRPVADIVFLHGLNGDRVRTWTKDGIFWPRDLLPKQLLQCRVMTFGYNADLGLSSSTLSIRDFAVSLLTGLRDERQRHDELGRPIIFVCHSLGGIVAKKALLVARVGDRYADISRSTAGLVFFGTPHRGSSVADFGAALNRIAKFLDRRELLSSLTSQNSTLLEISRDFVALVGIFNYSIVSFFEENRIAGVRLVVSRDSATMNITQEEALPLEGDHREMCRFRGPDDPRFSVAWNAIKRLIPEKKLDEISSADASFLQAIPGPDVEECLQGVKTPYGHSYDWICNHPTFVALQTSKIIHALHILGKPGSGKSTFAGYLYRTYFNNGLDRPVFFFSFAEKSRNTASSAWGCLLRQVIEYDTTRIQEIRLRSRRNRNAWSTYRLRNEFELLAKKGFSVTSLYIIDAIDECDDTVDDFLGSVETVLEGASDKSVKFLFLGRRQDTLAALRVRPGISSCISSIEIDREPCQLQAVRLYVEQKVEELCARRPGLRRRKDHIVRLLADKSDGMYLLPELAISSLRSRATSGYDADVMAELDRIPQKIQKIYRKALDEVVPQHRPTVSNLFLWMTFGLRPLSESEMSYALASTADPSVLRRYLDNHLQDAYFDILGDGGVQALVGALLKATETPSGVLKLELVHGTARRYLTEVPRRRDEDSESRVPDWLLEGIYGNWNLIEYRDDSIPRPMAYIHGFAHMAIYHQCFSTLEETLSQFAKSSDASGTDAPDFVAIGAMIPFFSYASEYIFEHARHVPMSNVSFYNEMARKLDDSESLGRLIRESFWYFKDPVLHKNQPLIHFACELGLEGLVASVVSKVSFGFRDRFYATPLNTAAATGIVPILDILCKSEKFDPTMSEKEDGTALHTAVYCGHLDATKYFLSRIPNGEHESLLRDAAGVAASTDNVAMLALFQSRQCLDTNTFSRAVRSGSTRVMDYLESLSIDVSQSDNATGLAAGSGALESLEWLERRCRIDNSFVGKWQPIHLAGMDGHPQVIDFLVRAGHARIDDPDKDGITALRHACQAGRYETVPTALRLGAKTHWRTDGPEPKEVTAIQEVLDQFTDRWWDADGRLKLTKTLWILLDMVQSLRDEPALNNKPATMAQYAHHFALEYFLKTRAEVFEDDPRGAHLSPEEQKIPARSLLDHFLGGVNSVDEWERTPLHNLMLAWSSIDPAPTNCTWRSGFHTLLACGADCLQGDILDMTPFDVYVYSITGLDPMGALSSPSQPFKAPSFVYDEILEKFCNKEPRLLKALDKQKEALLLAFSQQSRPCLKDTKLLLSRFTPADLSSWIRRHATAAVLLMLRDTGRPDEESIEFLDEMPATELAIILKADFFPLVRGWRGDQGKKVKISPLCQEALAILRQKAPALVAGAIAAATAKTRAQYSYSNPWTEAAILIHVQENCLPSEIPTSMKNSLFINAAEAGNLDGMRYLAERCSIDIDVPLDYRNRTALLISAAQCKDDVVEYLLSRRPPASVAITDHDGRNALELAATNWSSPDERRSRTIRVLFNNGARITDTVIQKVKDRGDSVSGVEGLLHLLEELKITQTVLRGEGPEASSPG